MTTKTPQLDRLESVIKLVNSSYVKPEELSGLFDAFVSTVKDLKVNLATSFKNGDESLDAKIRSSNIEIAKAIKDIENRLQKTIKDNQQLSSKEIASSIKKVMTDMDSVKSAIPKIPDTSYLDDKIDELGNIVSHLPTQSEVKKAVDIIQEELRLIQSELEEKIKDVSKLNPPNGPMLHPTSIGNLPDVNTVGAAVGQVLTWNGTYWYPTNANGGGGGFAIETPSGAINGVNDIFTVLNVPSFIFLNGVAYYQDNGYTLSGLTITIDSSLTPVAGSVLRSIYGSSSASGVTSIIAGTNITISPSGGTGAVTINASGGSIRGTFNNASLSAGILTVTHSFGLSAPYQVQVTIVNNSSQSIISPFICATNTVAIDLSALGTISGTYGYIISQ